MLKFLETYKIVFRSALFGPEEGGSKFLRNTFKFIQTTRRCKPEDSVFYIRRSAKLTLCTEFNRLAHDCVV